MYYDGSGCFLIKLYNGRQPNQFIQFFKINQFIQFFEINQFIQFFKIKFSSFSQSKISSFIKQNRSGKKNVGPYHRLYI